MNVTESALTVAFTATAGVAALLNLVILLSSLSKLHKLTPSSFLTYFLCFCDGIVTATDAVIGCSSLIMHRSLNRADYFLGLRICSIHGTLQIFGVSSSLFLCLGLTIFRFMIISREAILTQRFAYFYVAATLSGSVLISTLPFMLRSAESTYVLQPSGVYCITDWTSKDPQAIPLVTINLITLTPPIVFIGYTYTTIYFQFRKSLRELQKTTSSPCISGENITCNREGKSSQSLEVTPVTMASLVLHNANDEQRALLVQSVVIVFAFLAGWLPYTILIVHEVATSRYFSAAFDYLAIYCTLLNAAINPVIVISFNKEIRRNFTDFFGCSPRIPKSTLSGVS
ncbi:hypothetical protein BJ741DRAFT_664885 [Chytriomyces cf. hyalinus JEL632]|nr:hypothetical protein BJ741DRAFT_664885 [Chytriomyces cf. hyalinus JEL632]